MEFGQKGSFLKTKKKIGCWVFLTKLGFFDRMLGFFDFTHNKGSPLLASLIRMLGFLDYPILLLYSFPSVFIGQRQWFMMLLICLCTCMLICLYASLLSPLSMAARWAVTDFFVSSIEFIV